MMILKHKDFLCILFSIKTFEKNILNIYFNFHVHKIVFTFKISVVTKFLKILLKMSSLKCVIQNKLHIIIDNVFNKLKYFFLNEALFNMPAIF